MKIIEMPPFISMPCTPLFTRMLMPMTCADIRWMPRHDYFSDVYLHISHNASRRKYTMLTMISGLFRHYMLLLLTAATPRDFSRRRAVVMMPPYRHFSL